MRSGVHYLELILYMAYSELRAEATRAYLGFLWWFVEPVMYMAVFYLIFETGLRSGGADYAPFLLCGLVAWKWFASTVLAAANALARNAGVMQQVYLPKLVFPLALTVSYAFKFAMIFVILLFYLTVVAGKPVTTAWAALPVLLLVQLALIVAVSVLTASVVPFAPDLKLLLDNLMIMLFFVSGIFFDIANMSEAIQDMLRVNPMAVLIESYRAVLLHGVWPQWDRLAAIVAVSLVLLGVGVALFHKFDRAYPKLVGR